MKSLNEILIDLGILPGKLPVKPKKKKGAKK